MRYFIALFLLSISTFSSGQTELLDAKKLWARDSIRLGTNWIRSISKDTALLTVTDRDIPSAKAVKDFVLNRWNNGLLPWDNVTSKPSLLISGNNLADVSNLVTARTNLSVYSIATVNDSLLNHYTKSQADSRFKSISYIPDWVDITGKPANFSTTYLLSNDIQDSIQARIAKRDSLSGGYTSWLLTKKKTDSLGAVKQNTIYANVKDYGAVGDGVTDDRAAFVNAFASGLPVLVPIGKFYLSATLTLTKYQTIKGVGDSSIIILGTGNYPAFTIEGNYIKISNLSVKGQGRGTTTNYATTRPNQHGVYVLGQAGGALARSEISVDGCVFDSLGGSGVYIVNNRKIEYGNTVSVTNNIALNCYAGFTTANRGEYNTFVNNSASNCQYGVWNQGGNNSFVGGVLNYNMINFYLKKGDNDAHSTATNVTMNHALDYGILVDSIDVGWVFNGCNIWANSVLVRYSNGVHFSDCQIGAVTAILFAGSTNCTFNNTRWQSTPGFNLSYLGAASDVKFFGNIWESTPAPNIYNSIQNELVIPVAANKMLKTDALSRIVEAVPTTDYLTSSSLSTLGVFTGTVDNGFLARSNGTSLVNSTIRDNGINIGIGAAPQSGGANANWLSVNSTTSSYSGGFLYYRNGAQAAIDYATSTHKVSLAQTGYGSKITVNGTRDAMIFESTGIGTLPFVLQADGGINSKRTTVTSLFANKDSIPTTTTNVLGLTLDSATGRVQKINLRTNPLYGTKLIGNSSAPSVTLGSNITGSVSVTGTDMAGTITVTVTGISSLATLNELFTLTYNSAYSSTPHVAWSPASANAAALLQAAGGLYLKNSGTSSFQIATVNSYSTLASATYSFTYHVIQ